MEPFTTRPSPQLVGGPGSLAELPSCVHKSGGHKVLLVTDQGVAAAGHAGRAVTLLEDAGIACTVYDGTSENPEESDILAAMKFAREVGPDCFVGIGGGSSMDTAKGCNFLLTNGGAMSDYKGYGSARTPLLPFIGIPTTAGTGSECQSYAVISRDQSHEKMACGDPSALATYAILDPDLTASMPHRVAVLTALDALAHSLETAVSTRRNSFSSAYSREAFLHLSVAIEPVLKGEASASERNSMLMGSAFAGLAIENSMLGAAHASANPLTASCGLAHGHAVALMLPHVIGLNEEVPEARDTYAHYGTLLSSCRGVDSGVRAWVEHLLAVADLSPLEECGVNADVFPELAEDATRQWTGQFNPRSMKRQDFEILYECALRGATPQGM